MQGNPRPRGQVRARAARARRGATASAAWTVAIAAALATLAVPATALADRGGASDPVGDAQPGTGQLPAFTDITRVKHGHGGGKRLRHVVFVRDANRATKALTQLEIKARGRLYLIDAAGVNRFRSQRSARLESGSAERAGKRKAKVKRRGNKIIFKFGPRAIDAPRKYRWAATIGANDTSPLDFDRAPKGWIRHRLRSGGGNRPAAKRDRFRGYRAGADGKPGRVATQGELHEFVFVDRRRERTRYKLVLSGPGNAKRKTRARTGRRGRDRIDASLFVNDVGGPGRWKAKWKVGGERVARYRFRLEPEFEG